jgi:nucleoside-diphosphate-sugar epimerase
MAMITGDRADARTALVTGATGYIGSHVARRLAARGWTVHAVARPNSSLKLLRESIDRIEVHRHDGSTEHLIAIVGRSAPDVVFHLAAVSTVRHTPGLIVPMLQSNVVFGTQLLEAMTAHGVSRLINTGTYSQHYDNREYGPSSLYDATKQAFRTILQYYAETTPLHSITLELFDNYGPGDPRPKIMSLLQRTAREGETLAMTPGEQLIDLVYIDDVAEAYALAAERLLSGDAGKDETFAVSSGRPIRLRELVRVYERVTGCRLSIEWGGRPYRMREIMVPWNKGKPLPGWKPAVSLEEGIRRTTGAM